MISYTSPYNNLIRVSAQESQVLKGTFTYPITPAKNHNDGLMVDVFFSLKPHIQSIATISGFSNTITLPFPSSMS